MKKSIETIWFWWIFLSAIYIGLNFLGYPVDNPLRSYSTALALFSTILGLFVPYGLYSILYFMDSFFPSLISILVFFLLMYLAHKRISILTISTLLKVAVILLGLLIITTTVDLIRGTPFESWIILLQGGLSTHY